MALQGISSADLQALETKKKMGAVYKRGSGVGLFASTKWKQKLLAAAGGSLVYFDSTAIGAKNRAAKVLLLKGAYAEQLDGAKYASKPKKAQFVFQVVAPARSMLFGCESQADVDAWLLSIRTEIEAAAETV